MLFSILSIWFVALPDIEEKEDARKTKPVAEHYQVLITKMRLSIQSLMIISIQISLHTYTIYKTSRQIHVHMMVKFWS